MISPDFSLSQIQGLVICWWFLLGATPLYSVLLIVSLAIGKYDSPTGSMSTRLPHALVSRVVSGRVRGQSGNTPFYFVNSGGFFGQCT